MHYTVLPSYISKSVMQYIDVIMKILLYNEEVCLLLDDDLSAFNLLPI